MYVVCLFNDIEFYSFDGLKNGYCEVFICEWNEIVDMCFSEKDVNECKIMNIYLYIFEFYINLYWVWKDVWLECQFYNLIGFFIEKILDKDIFYL